MSEYPLQIQSSGLDITSMMLSATGSGVESGDGEVGVTQTVTNMFSKINSNDLESLNFSGQRGKWYSGIHKCD